MIIFIWSGRRLTGVHRNNYEAGGRQIRPQMAEHNNHLIAEIPDPDCHFNQSNLNRKPRWPPDFMEMDLHNL